MARFGRRARTAEGRSGARQLSAGAGGDVPLSRAALVSHPPGGLGVLEFTFRKAKPDVPPAQLMAALLTFRLLYLIAPLSVSLAIVAISRKGRPFAGPRER